MPSSFVALAAPLDCLPFCTVIMYNAGESDECLACLESIAADSQALRCTECRHTYHIGKCAGITKTKIKALKPEEVSAWSCATCRARTQRLAPQKDSQETAVARKTDEEKHAAMMEQILKTNQKLGEVLSRIENIEQKLNIQSLKHDTAIEKLDNQEKTIQAIETSITMLSKQYDDLIKKVDSLTSVTADLRKRTDKIEQLGYEADTRIKDLERAVENAEQDSRRKNIEIHGIAQRDRENLAAVMKNLAAKLNLSVPEPDKIECMYRLKARDGKIPPIIVRFNDRLERDRWASKRTALKDEHVFINENLTRLQRWLLWNTKDCAREMGYRYVWMKNGKIFVRKRDGAVAMRIDDESDLNKIQ